MGVSIHTSAREVTNTDVQKLRLYCVSIHTSAREVTDVNAKTTRRGQFQSTLPQGK